jgi:5-dehydro-2-deoxygluconokinase
MSRLDPLEVITMGRVGIDLYPHQPGPLRTVQTFGRYLGGTATNVAVAAARLGRSAAVITKVGADPFGDYVRDALASFGVDARFVGTDPVLRTPLVFTALDPPEDPPLLFYREPTAPDLQLRPDELPIDEIRTVPLLWVTGTGLSAEPSRAATLHALDVRTRGRGQAVRGQVPSRDQAAMTVIDLDFRPMFWASPDAARAALDQALPLATVAVGNRREVEVAVGTDEPDRAADRLLERGLDLAVVKLGGDGVLVATPAARATVGSLPVDVVCGLGAGDAFGGALCHGLLAGWDPERTARYANAAGAIVAGRLACADAMPTAAEIDTLLETTDVC